MTDQPRHFLPGLAGADSVMPTPAPTPTSAVAGNGPLAGYTQYYALNLVNFDWVTWHGYEWENWVAVDALLHAVYTKPEANDIFVDVAGDTMTGPLTMALGAYIRVGDFFIGADDFGAAVPNTVSVSLGSAIILKSGVYSTSPSNLYVRGYDGVTIASFDAANDTAYFADTVMTRRKTDLRYYTKTQQDTNDAAAATAQDARDDAQDDAIAAIQLIPGPVGPVGATGATGATGAKGDPGGQVMYIGDGPPAAPIVGQTWYESDTGNSFIYYDDGNSAQWVPSHVGALPGGDGGEPVEGPPGPAGPAGPQGEPGPTGPAGATGATGTAGATGAQGPKGDTGATGATGTGAWTDITGKPSTFPPTLPIAQSGITSLVTDLAAKEPTIAAGATTKFLSGNKTWQRSFTQMTQAAYDGLGTKDADTLYVIIG